jgi:hypothetical protein
VIPIIFRVQLHRNSKAVATRPAFRSRETLSLPGNGSRSLTTSNSQSLYMFLYRRSDDSTRAVAQTHWEVPRMTRCVQSSARSSNRRVRRQKRKRSRVDNPRQIAALREQKAE